MIPAPIVVVGGGLSGLSVAVRVSGAGREAVLLEAQDRLGGRIHTIELGGVPVDLGPAWVWPHQPRVGALASELGLRLFPQHATGALVHQDLAGRRRVLDMATMAGALRVAGGMGRLVSGLAARLDPASIKMNEPVTRLTATEHGVAVSTASGGRLEAARVVLAMPPRIARDRIAFDPPLPASTSSEMGRIPTWMAGHAKAVAVYPTPFWRDVGLSGDGMSQQGPLVELHDATPADPKTGGALFGFFGPPAAWRREHQGELGSLVLGQLEAMYGRPAARPEALRLVDWAEDPWVATAADRVPPTAHPTYGPLPRLPLPWRDRVLVTGTELAPMEGGYVEGALAAADATARSLVEA